MKKIMFNLLLTLISLNGCKSQNPSESITVIDINTLEQEVIGKNTQLIDVRTSFEFKKGAIDNALNANILSSDFPEKIASLNKNLPVYVYCQKGGRSNVAANKLATLGFSEIYDFKGGWKAWSKHLKASKNK